MKRKLFVVSLITAILMLTINAWAAKEEKEFGVHARTKYGVQDVVEGTVDVETGEHIVELDDGKLEIRVSGILDETARLMVMPIKKDKKEVWAWLQSITKEIGENKSAYDIFFVNDTGDRIEVGEGSQVSVISNVRTQEVSVYYITDEGKHNALKAIIEEYVVKFNMVRNGYYTLLVQNGKDQIGTGLEKGDEDIKPTNDGNEVDDPNEDSKDDETDEEFDDVEDGIESDKSGQVAGEQSDNIWLIIMLVVVVITVVLFVIIFAKKKKSKEE